MFEMAAGEVLTPSQDHVIAYVAFFGGARKKVDRKMETVPGLFQSSSTIKISGTS